LIDKVTDFWFSD